MSKDRKMQILTMICSDIWLIFTILTNMEEGLHISDVLMVLAFIIWNVLIIKKKEQNHIMAIIALIIFLVGFVLEILYMIEII